MSFFLNQVLFGSQTIPVVRPSHFEILPGPALVSSPTITTYCTITECWSLRLWQCYFCKSKDQRGTISMKTSWLCAALRLWWDQPTVDTAVSETFLINNTNSAAVFSWNVPQCVFVIWCWRSPLVCQSSFDQSKSHWGLKLLIYAALGRVAFLGLNKKEINFSSVPRQSL